MILEEALFQAAFASSESSAHDNLPRIICTEPRRLSAVTVAKRVSSELGEGLVDRAALVMVSCFVVRALRRRPRPVRMRRRADRRGTGIRDTRIK